MQLNEEIFKEIEESINDKKQFKHDVVNGLKPSFAEKNWLLIMILSGVFNCALTICVSIYLPFGSQQLIEKKQSKVDTVYVVNQTTHDTVYIYSKGK